MNLTPLEILKLGLSQGHGADVLLASLEAGGWQVVQGWQPIETAPKDGRFMWLSNGRMMRIGYWYIITADPSKEHWADMIRAERGGMGDLQWEPKYWMPTPTSPDRSKWSIEPKEPRLVQCECGWVGTDNNLVAETPGSAHCPVCRAVFTEWKPQVSPLKGG